MDAKQYLLQIERLDRQAQAKVDEIHRLQSAATSITVFPKDVNVQTWSEPDRLGATVTRIVDLQAEANELVDQFVDFKEKVKSQMKNLEDSKHYNILYERYFKYKSIYQIAGENQGDYSRWKRLHAQALAEFQKILDVEQENK